MDMKRDFLAEYSGECLYHHGIMGQKWGVRRYQNKDGSLTEEGRKRYGQKGTVYRKGTEFYRVSTSKDEKENRDYTYMTRLQSDRDYYKGIYAQDIMFDPHKYTSESYAKAKLKDIVDDYKKEHNIYELTYKAKQDLISPNKRERVRVFKELIKQNPELIKRVHDDLIRDKFFGKDQNRRKEIDEVLSISGNRKMKDVIDDKRAFKMFSSALNDSSDVRKKYFEILMKYGYNVIVDDNDAGEITRAPLIAINPKDILQLAYAKELMAKDIGEAYNRQRIRFKKQGYDIGKIDKDEWR